MGEPEQSEVDDFVRFLRQEQRWIEKAADRLDGAGLWAAAKSAWVAAERVEEIVQAVIGRAGGGRKGR